MIEEMLDLKSELQLIHAEIFFLQCTDRQFRVIDKYLNKPRKPRNGKKLLGGT